MYLLFRPFNIFRDLAFAVLTIALLMLCGPGTVRAQSNTQPATMNGSGFQNGTPLAPGITGGNGFYGLFFGGAASPRVGYSGHLESGAGNSLTPALSGCGTTPTLGNGSTDSAGTVTMGTTATGCVITFGVPYTAAPTCTVTWRATPLASQSYTVSTTALTLTQTSTSNNLADYTCVAKSGG